MTIKLTLPTCLLFAVGSTLHAQSGLSTPAEFLGYELGARFTPHHRVVAYFEHVAAQAPNVILRRYGATYEHRPLLVALVSSVENIGRLEEIRTDNLRRARALAGQPSNDTTTMVWLSYNVHGNESVSTEASLITLYDLANVENARTQRWLANTVVVLDPAINPDGRDRYVAWYNQVVGAQPNATPTAREHREPWPGGRTNHYMFDLNRDWAWLTQKESQERIALYRQWLPHVHVDFHEQSINSPYYFAPAAEPYHAAVTDWQREFQRTIGRNHMKYFDANGWLYFTRETFDLLYPGYGDTYPMFNGAIGMTYEQAGGGRAGLAIVKADGDTLTLSDRIAHHHTTGLSTVETASEHAGRLVSEFSRYFEIAVSNPPGEYKTFVVKGDNDADKLDELRDLLDRHDIAYGSAVRQRSVRGFNLTTGVTEDTRLEPTDLLITAYQPQAALIRVLFEPRTAVADSVTYDITAWSLPYAYGLHTFALTDRIDIASPDDRASPLNVVTERPYAYLAGWKSVADVRFLAALLNRGVKVRFAQEPFEVNGAAYDRGTLIVTRTGNERLGDEFDRVVTDAAAETNQRIIGTPTGGASTGPDFGSSSVRYIDPAHVVVAAGEGVSSGAMGQVWHFFDQQIRYPTTLVNGSDLDQLDLSTVDVIVLPNGSYAQHLDDDALSDLQTWIRAGGRLIVMEGAVRFLSGKDGFAIERETDDDDEDESSHETDDDERDAALKKFGDRERAGTTDNVPGAIYKLQMDDTHPLGFGYPDYYFTLKRGNERYLYLEDDWNVGVLRGDSYVSGFVGSEARENLQNTLVFGVQDLGGGAVVYLVDNPLFRAFWQNGKLVFANAVFLVGQ